MIHRRFMRIDLHTHSNKSDGTDTPAELMTRAAAAGLDVVALTDHDTVAGWEEAADALPARLTLVPGAEISCGADGHTIHLLGYLFDPDEPVFEEERQRLATDRSRRGRVIVEKLQALGVGVTWDRVAELAAGGSVGRPHVARAMVELGVVPDVAAAFTPEWLAKGGRAYAEKYVLEPAAAIEMVRRAGGVTVLAHPMGSGRAVGDGVETLIERLAAAGLTGVEVDHPDHDAGGRAQLARLAARLDLVPTGSSDYHGGIKPTPLAAELTAPAAYERLVAGATGRRPLGR